MADPGRKIAVVLFNLGGPGGQDDVRPFLQNLFSDPAIIGAPAPVRLPLAWFIAKRRETMAKANYALMGGGSPLLKETQGQAKALQAALARRLPDDQVKIFIAMRYWSPTTAQTAREVAAFAPDEVVLVPLYPQYSTTSSASSLKAWREAYKGPGRQFTLCCWHSNEGLVEAHADAIRRTWDAAGRPQVRLLFSAHGVPESVIGKGDPYQWQIEQTCAAVAARLGEGWDWSLCYQSRVGPMKWLGPSTQAAIHTAAEEGLGVLIDPIAFVSEHIETLVELDIEYAHLAHELGMQTYLRAPAVGVDAIFIEGLAAAAHKALEGLSVTADGARCPGAFTGCGQRVHLQQPGAHRA
ncbi:MAG TPA: ferrochelatase [Caulobacteraceae bacterium]